MTERAGFKQYLFWFSDDDRSRLDVLGDFVASKAPVEFDRSRSPIVDAIRFALADFNAAMSLPRSVVGPSPASETTTSLNVRLRERERETIASIRKALGFQSDRDAVTYAIRLSFIRRGLTVDLPEIADA